MSISDMIVVMKDGELHQFGKPQEVYDDPANLFVAKFLGTPPINVFSGLIAAGTLYIGNDAVMRLPGAEDREVYVGIRPEGFVPDPNGPLRCRLNAVEVMGRDVSVVSEHPASVNPTVRSIISADDMPQTDVEQISFRIKPHKIFLFDADTEERVEC